MPKSLVIAAVGATLVAALLPSVVLGATPSRGPIASAPGYMVPVYAGRTSGADRLSPGATVRGGSAIATTLTPTSTIRVTYHGFSPQAKAAFQAAVNVWQSIVVSDQVIHVDASWSDLGPFSGILGQAGANDVYRESDHFWYPGPLEEARCHCDAETGTEISAEFNSKFPYWYMGTDGNVPNSKWDLETVVLHELGHGLGFFSSFSVSGNQGFWGFGGRPLRFDANEWSAATGGSQLIKFSSGTTTLKTQLTDKSVFLGGSHVEAALGGRAKLYAPAGWQSGSSNSHLDENKYRPGTINGLMTPVLNNGEAIHDPGPAVKAIFQDIGWTISGSSGDTTAPAVGTPSIAFASGQTMGSAVTVAISWPAASDASGIAAYELQMRTGTAAWTSVTLASPTSTSAHLSVARSSSYSFRVRATDGVGNVGNWSQTPSAAISTVQETSNAIAYAGTWSSAALGGASGGNVEQSSATDSTATLTFTGTSVAFVSTLAPGRGIATVTIDGTTVDQAHLYAGAKRTKVVVWASDSLSSGAHTLEVRVTGTKDANATSTRIDVDAFLVWP